ncbi:hypothetical protein EDB83DRAFT_1549483 [Lactarius deliciosus]|nr:hypothetical protein EDB83DRAFT_1549483 [Lactarius deliciosus]
MSHWQPVSPLTLLSHNVLVEAQISQLTGALPVASHGTGRNRDVDLVSNRFNEAHHRGRSDFSIGLGISRGWADPSTFSRSLSLEARARVTARPCVAGDDIFRAPRPCPN